MEFEKLKKNNFPTDRPIPEKQGWVRGNEIIFKVGPSYLHEVSLVMRKPAFCICENKDADLSASRYSRFGASMDIG